MMQIYDDPEFFRVYSQMDRSRHGLSAAGEWHQLEKLFPDVGGMTVLDLGCGYGWHSKYCAEQEAATVLGIDASTAMIAEAKKRNADPCITYRVCSLEDYDYPAGAYDLVLSNLVLHYVEDLEKVYRKVYETLKPGGIFFLILSIRHLQQLPVRIGYVRKGNHCAGLWIGISIPENGRQYFSDTL